MILIFIRVYSFVAKKEEQLRREEGRNDDLVMCLVFYMVITTRLL